MNSVASQIPIPFGKKEICWLTTNPSTDNVYTNGSILEDSIDTVLNLVYGNKYNLDFYANGNTPEGIINAQGASKKDLKKIREQLNHSIQTPRDSFNMKRRIGFRMPVVNMDNLDFVKLNLSSQEMEILNQQQWFTKILWMRAGLTADDMGFTDDSNRATSTQQTANSRRKALKPIFTLWSECATYEILPEFEDGELLEWCFKFDEIADQKFKRELQQLEIEMGITTAQEIMREEGIDLDQIKKDKEENQQQEMGFSNFEGFTNQPQEQKDKENLKDSEKETKSNMPELKPFGPYSNFNDCVSKNKDKRDPEAYCGVVQRKIEDKGEYKAHAGNSVESSRHGRHIHTIPEGDEYSSFDGDDFDKVHEHKVDEINYKLLAGGEDNHTHDFPSFHEKLKGSEKEMKATLPKTSALETAMKEYDKEFTKMLKDVINKA